MTVTDLPAPTFRTVDLALTANDIDGIEATDCVLHGQTDEHVDVGPIAALGGAYLRIRAADLVEVADGLLALAYRMIDTVMEARQEALDLERHRCSCGGLLELEEDTCGAVVCQRRYAQEMAS